MPRYHTKPLSVQCSASNPIHGAEGCIQTHAFDDGLFWSGAIMAAYPKVNHPRRGAMGIVWAYPQDGNTTLTMFWVYASLIGEV